jgi:glycosyltransferase involved in cell wall biosynthesis
MERGNAWRIMGNHDPLHIGFIAPFLFRFQRGIERFCTHLANELVQMGQLVSILTWHEPNGQTASPLDPRIRVVRVPYVRYYRSRWAIPFYVFELLTKPYDVVNIFFAGYGEAEALTFARKWRSFRTNFIAGYPIEQVPHRFHEFRRYGLDQALHRIIVKSPSMAPGIARFFGREVEVIPNGVDVDIFHPAQVDAEPLRRRLGLQNEDHVLLTVAALEERKGVQHVIRVLPDLLQAGLSVHYFIVGDGPYRATLETLAAKHQVADRVHFVGTVTDVLPYYQLADIFLLLSYGEGFPNVLLEAWATALPVIVSKHPPYPEIVPSEVGALVDEQNSDVLRTTLVEWLASPSICHHIGARARSYVSGHYAWSIIAREFMDVFLRDKSTTTSRSCEEI